jgi:hypothetical protein
VFRVVASDHPLWLRPSGWPPAFVRLEPVRLAISIAGAPTEPGCRPSRPTAPHSGPPLNRAPEIGAIRFWLSTRRGETPPPGCATGRWLVPRQFSFSPGRPPPPEHFPNGRFDAARLPHSPAGKDYKRGSPQSWLDRRDAARPPAHVRFRVAPVPGRSGSGRRRAPARR